MFIYCNVKLGWTPAKKGIPARFSVGNHLETGRSRPVGFVSMRRLVAQRNNNHKAAVDWICGSADGMVDNLHIAPGAATFECWDPGPPAKRHMAAEFFFFRGKFGKGWTWQVQSIYKNIVKQRKGDWVFFVVFYVAMGLIHPHQQLDGLMDSVPTQPFRASGCGLWSPRAASQLRNVWGLVLPIQSSSHSLQNLLLEAMRYRYRRNGREGVLRSSGWSRSISLFFQERLVERRQEGWKSECLFCQFSQPINLQ